MISNTEIKEIARRFRIPTSSIERDYAQNWLLSSFQSFKGALKGGTSIRKVFIENYRFSDDLDFTALHYYDKEDLIQIIKDSVSIARDESGIFFQDNIGIKEIKSGHRATVYFQSMLTKTTTSRIGIHLDITTPDEEKILCSPEKRLIFRPCRKPT